MGHRVSLPIFIAAEVAVAHMAWHAKGGCPSEVLAGYGTALGLIGLAVVGIPMFRNGALNRAVAGALPQDHRTFAQNHDPNASLRRNALIADVRASVISGRIMAALFIAAGTVLNGYSSLIARHLGLVGAC